MVKSSTSSKVEKPYPGFPLTPHPSGRWCKKIRGKLFYFGKIDDPTAALGRFNRDWPYLKDGRTPPPIDTGDGCTVRLLVNSFLTTKQMLLDSGELAARTFAEYYRFGGILVDYLRDRRVDDLRPDDFQALRRKLAERFGAVALHGAINYCRMIFKFAFDQRLIDRPVHYGQSFDRPSRKTLRKVRNAKGKKMFTADEASRIVEAASGPLKAMTLLGLNCGFGNTDCSSLPKAAVDLNGRWIEFPRTKTGINRRIPLWPETVEALRSAIMSRPAPEDGADAALVFLLRNGTRWVRTKKSTKTGHTINLDAVSKEFARLLKSLGINSHRNFYTLRHVFETIAGESRDQVAVNAIMGHVDTSMGAVYREGISDDRLLAAVNTVRAWLFSNDAAAASSPDDDARVLVFPKGTRAVK